jgi:glycosidase
MAGQDVTYTLRVSRFVGCDDVYFVLIDDSKSENASRRIKMPLYESNESHFTYQMTLKFENAGLYWYHFELQYAGAKYYLCKNQTFDVESTGEVGASFAQVVYKRESRVDKKYRSGITYHVFVDRFKKSGKVTKKDSMVLRSDWGGEITKNSTDFLEINREAFGGNIQGVIDKLDYIKGLGVSTIFLSPIFESHSYHKYDTADFGNVDSMFGGNKALKDLVTEAKKHDINILLDGVFNHCGSDSIYFNKLGNYNSVGAYQSQKSKYFDWFVFHKFPDEYCSWWGFDTLPQFNESSKSLQKFITGPAGVIEKHMKTGILGFRLDVADELTDEYLNKICASVRKQKKDAIIMGEVWEDAATKLAYGKRRSYFSGLQLNSVMNYPLKGGIIDFVLHRNAEALASVFYMLQDHYPREVAYNLMNFLGSHDTKRILTILKEHGEKEAFGRLKIATAILYCAPGVPAIFYGDEAGVVGGDAPFSRVCFPWGKEDKETLAWYRKLGELRTKEIFANGDCNVLFAHNGVFIMERKLGDSRVILAANCSHDDFKLNLETMMTNFETGKLVKDSILLKPYSFVILSTCP